MPPSILSQLYYGEICPSASLECDREAYQKTTKELITVLEQIEEVIPLQSYPLLEELQECYNMRNSVELEAAFVQGFRLGAQIILEVQNRDIPILGDISVSVCGSDCKK